MLFNNFLKIKILMFVYIPILLFLKKEIVTVRYTNRTDYFINAIV